MNSLQRMPLKKNILKLPRHIGILIDGNRRWAKEKKLSSYKGHERGIERVIEIIDYAYLKKIKVLTLFGFSTENWKRPQKEVNYLMALFTKFAKKYASEFHKKGIRFRHIGNLAGLPHSLQQEIIKAQHLTSSNKLMHLNIALNYGGRDEVVRAVKKIIEEKFTSSEITEKVLMNHLDTAGLPDVDLVIRTSGERRLSNFLPLQSTYAELYFPPIYWPDFDTHQFDLALEEFSSRKRRFGK